MHLFHKKETLPEAYDPAAVVPRLHKSICTGETTAGFEDLKTGKYEDVMLIRTEKDLETFMRRYGLTEPPKTIY